MNDSSIGIIGGADGPTEMFISGSPVPAIIIAVILAAVIIGIIVLVKKRKNDIERIP